MKPSVVALSLFFLLALSVPAFAYSVPADTAVYVTKSGTKYHRADCYHLTASAQEMTIEEAVAKGYEPCTYCRPDVPREGAEVAAQVPQHTPARGDGVIALIGLCALFSGAGIKYFSEKKHKEAP